MTISLCMIVKNEEAILARCLESVSGCFDEIIILDTGSNDRTCEIAKKYTEHVFETTWNDDFSKARNESFSYATCDYIMWLDADDILTEENKKRLIHLKNTESDHADLYFMNYATAYDEQDNPTFYYERERIVKRTTPHRWEGCVHETLQCNGIYKRIDITICHKSVKKTYSKRNLYILSTKLKADGFLKPREWYYYARELFYHKQYFDAIHSLESYLMSKTGWIENRIDAYLILSKCYEAIGDVNTALASLFRSLQESLPRAETCCEIGRLFMKLENYQSAIWWYQLAMDGCEAPSNGAFINTDYSKYVPCLQLCVCFDKIGNYKTAKYYHQMIAEERPWSTAVQHNMHYFESLEQNGIL